MASAMERNRGQWKQNGAGSWSPSLDYSIRKGFSALTMGKYKLGISKKWEGRIGSEVFTGNRKVIRER